MSRIGKLPVTVPAGVKIELSGDRISVQGPKGSLARTLPPHVEAAQEDGKVVIRRQDDGRAARAMHGLTRTLIQNMVTGVSTGFSKTLEIIGVGYRVESKKNYLVFTLGYSHPIYYELPQGIEAKIESPTRLTVSGIDREIVGKAAAEIRGFRPPEPYKGKGVKYVDETIQRKEGKSGGR